MDLSEQIVNYGYRNGPCSPVICHNVEEGCIHECEALCDRVLRNIKPVAVALYQLMRQTVLANGFNLDITRNICNPDFAFVHRPGATLREYWDAAHVRQQYEWADLQPPAESLFDAPIVDLLPQVALESDIRVTGLVYGYPVEATISKFSFPLRERSEALATCVARFGSTPVTALTLAGRWDAQHVIRQYKCADLEPPGEEVFHQPIAQLLDDRDPRIVGLIRGWPVETLISLLVRSGEPSITEMALEEGGYECATCHNYYGDDQDYSSDENSDGDDWEGHSSDKSE